MREKVVLIGAGSAMFTRGLMRDMIHRRWEADVALVDIDPEALASAVGLARKMIEATRAPLRLSGTIDRREALPGATVVITTIGVGGRRAWEQDVLVPRRYGIYQSTGDSVMPGGTSRVLRMVPPMIRIAEDVVELAPQALFFNYSNPMLAVCRAVRKATGAKVVGLCHGTSQTHRYLARMLGAPAERLGFTAAGVNHLTWFTELRIDGRDLMPQLKQVAARKLAGRVLIQDVDVQTCPAPWDESGLTVDHPFSWQLLKWFGAFPAVMDRHVTEFFPRLFGGKESYYGRTLGVDAFSFEAVVEFGDRIYADMAERASSPSRLSPEYLDRIEGEHEQVVEIIESIRRDLGRVYSANLPNRGQVPNLPPEAIVESPAAADCAGLRPLSLPALDPGLAGQLAARFQWAETAVDAAVQGSREKFVQALLLDGSVSSLEAAVQLADDLLQAQAEHLPQFAMRTPEVESPRRPELLHEAAPHLFPPHRRAGRASRRLTQL